ncbi:hypothetical protein RSOLAG1IB_11188 [Rhizoctonia solani AG-1 IB]|uniref:Uncharacterized protein n=1 Tax=Thanatephorus cucumeris (strain AG1-IB / isolate 7/3/14) TaxID=1108050 RepID=A0A0B7F9F4_THACB|nr:hypothetical protein RSOLAG1IB_11188 [Rhizoctonia solani AG-1 IB]
MATKRCGRASGRKGLWTGSWLKDYKSGVAACGPSNFPSPALAMNSDTVNNPVRVPNSSHLLRFGDDSRRIALCPSVEVQKSVVCITVWMPSPHRRFGSRPWWKRA